MTSISPGYVETEFHRKFYESREVSKELYESIPPLQAEDIADAVFYALSTPPHVAIHDLLIRSRHQST